MDFNIKKINRLKTIVTIILIIFAAMSAYVFKDLFNRVEEKLVDFRTSLSTDSGLYANKFKPANPDIVIISIDDLTQYEASRSAELNLSRWPWSRKVWSNVVEFLEKENPRMIVIDLNFSNYEDLSLNRSSADMILSSTLSKYNNIILATALRTPYSDTKNIVSAKILDNFDNPFLPSQGSLDLKIDNPELVNKISYYSHTPIPDIYTQNTTMAVTNLDYSQTSPLVRYSQPVYRLVKGNKTYYMPSVGLAVLMKYLETDEINFAPEGASGALYLKNHKIPVNEDGKVLINWHGDNSYQSIPVNAILLSMVRGNNYFEFENHQVPTEFFKDKIILIAQTQLNSETHNTPVAHELHDAQIKATIIDNYINDADITNLQKRHFVKKLPLFKTVILTTAFCAAIIFVIVIATNMLLAFLNSFLIVTIYSWLCVLLFLHPRFHVLLDMAMPLYCMGVTLVLTFILKVHHEYKKRRKIERIFGNLVSEKVLKQLIEKPHKLNLKAGLQQVTIMSCNIYNHVQINDSVSPEYYIEIINKAFNTIEDIIFKYNGTINRFVGNSVLVYWGYPIHSRKDTESAIKAAFEIQEAINIFNMEHFACVDKKEGIDVKIALNTGSALIGQIGSKNVSDFTLLGDTVDIIEKIENVCVEFNKGIIATEETLNNVDKEPEIAFCGQIRIKNSEEKIKLYELKSLISKKRFCRDKI